ASSPCGPRGRPWPRSPGGRTFACSGPGSCCSRPGRCWRPGDHLAAVRTPLPAARRGRNGPEAQGPVPRGPDGLHPLPPAPCYFLDAEGGALRVDAEVGLEAATLTPGEAEPFPHFVALLGPPHFTEDLFRVGIFVVPRGARADYPTFTPPLAV